MKTVCFAVALLFVLVLRSQSHPRHAKNQKDVAKEHLAFRPSSSLHEVNVFLAQ